jgi:hypothetical protein
MRRWRWGVVGLLIVGVVLMTMMPRNSEGHAARELRKLGAEITRDETRAGKPVVAVNLTSTEINPEDLDLLLALPHLERVDLSRVAVTDEGLARISGLSGLRVLNLSGTKVTDAGLAHLQGLTDLEELRLARTAVSDKGLVHLRPLTKLRVLVLSGTGVSAIGAARWRKAMPKCRTEL